MARMYYQALHDMCFSSESKGYKWDDVLLDQTTLNIVTKEYKTHAYYAAEEALTHYREAVMLFGIRRTGKTTVMEQLWDKYKTEHSVFLTLTRGMLVKDLVRYLKETYTSIDLLFIDEITLLHDLDYSFHILLDYYKKLGTKIICAGTDSYFLVLSQNDTALGRLNKIKFLPLLFEDLQQVNIGYSFESYCTQGKLFVEDTYEKTIAENIFSSIERSIYSTHSLQGESVDDIQKAILLLVELLLGYVRNKLPSLKIRLDYTKYIIDEPKILNVSPMNKSCLNDLFNILISLDAIMIEPRYEITTVNDTCELVLSDRMFYVTLPALYHSALLVLTGDPNIGITDKYFGTLFEAAAVTQIKAKLEQLGVLGPRSATFSLRSDNSYEIDYCIVNRDTLTMIEFKTSSKKTAKHFYHPLVQKFCAKYNKVNRYVVYLYEDRVKPEKENETVKYIHIEDFLFNLQDYIQ